MWIVLWSFVAMPLGIVGTMQPERKFDTKELCEQHVKDYEPRMPDYVRGSINVGWGVEIFVKGTCQLPEVPA